MIRVHQIALPLDHPFEALPKAVAKRPEAAAEALGELQPFRRSVDARHKGAIELVYSVDVPVADEAAVLGRLRRDSRVMATPDPLVRPSIPAPVAYANGNRPRPVVVGAGLRLLRSLVFAQQGYRPLLLERGKPVKQRTADTFGFWKGRLPFNPASNAQFGEGGAGTFSDGKLYSGVKESSAMAVGFEELVESGANPELVLNKPTSAPSLVGVGSCVSASLISAVRCALSTTSLG